MNSSFAGRRRSVLELVDHDVAAAAHTAATRRHRPRAPGLATARRSRDRRRRRWPGRCPPPLLASSTVAQPANRARARHRHEYADIASVYHGLWRDAPSTTGPLDRRFAADARTLRRSRRCSSAAGALPAGCCRTTPVSTSSRSTARSPTAPSINPATSPRRRSCRACLPALGVRRSPSVRPSTGPKICAASASSGPAQRRSTAAAYPSDQRSGRLLRRARHARRRRQRRGRRAWSTAASSPSHHRHHEHQDHRHARQPRALARRASPSPRSTPGSFQATQP